tara:strand:- start:187 stop:855 length:669 start_codon:yes stop_codon:yes gene_type:complete
MQKARKFLTERVNTFLTDPLEVEVISVTNHKVSYRNVTSEENKAYHEHHKQMLKDEQHLGAHDDYALLLAPKCFDDLTWMCTMHQDQRLLGIKYFDHIEITFLTYAEFLLIKPLAMQEKRLIDRRMGPEQTHIDAKTRNEMQSLYNFASRTHESKKGRNSKMHKNITGGTTNSQTTNVAWGYMKKFQDRIRQINRHQTFGFVNETTLDNVIDLNVARNQNIM